MKFDILKYSVLAFSMMVSLMGCATGDSVAKAADVNKTPTEIVEFLAGTDRSPKAFSGIDDVRSIRHLVEPQIYDRLVRRSKLIARVGKYKLTDLDDRLLYEDLESLNPFTGCRGLSPKAVMKESISAETASVEVTDDYYGQDGSVLGVLRLRFHFKRSKSQWVLTDEDIVRDRTTSNFRGIREESLTHSLNEMNGWLQKMF